MRYHPIEPYQAGNLKVSGLHTLYYELSGNTEGEPVVFLHGGPGSGTSPSHRTLFSPNNYKIVLFDQRGSGKSTPYGSIEDNTTWDLVDDIEKLRKHLAIGKWHVFGGSWGSTLALVYAQSHPDRVKSLVLRGIFTARKSEIDFSCQNGASHIFPEAWEEFIAPIPKEEQKDILLAYLTRLDSNNQAIRTKAARQWSKWESSFSNFSIDEENIMEVTKDADAIAKSRIEYHYLMNKGFMRDGQILEERQIDKIRHIPCIVVQGRYDMACPTTTAYSLKKVWPELDLRIVPNAGHSTRDSGMEKHLVEATNEMADLD